MATASATQGSGSPSLHSLHPKDKWGQAHLMNVVDAFLSEQSVAITQPSRF